MSMIKDKRKFKSVLLFLSLLILLLISSFSYYYFKEKNVLPVSAPYKMEIGYHLFEDITFSNENKEEIEDIWNKIKPVISQASVDASFVKTLETIANLSFKFDKGKEVQACIYSGSILNNKNSEETKFILSFNRKYYLSPDLGYIVGALSQMSLREATIELISSAERVTIFADKLNEAQTYVEHEVTKDERGKLISALKEARISPLFGGPETVESGRAPPYPFYSIEMKRGSLIAHVNWLEENCDYLQITFENSSNIVNADETSKTLYQANHELLKACGEILPVATPKPPDIRYLFLADSAKLTKENMGMKDMQISQREIHCILTTILEKDLYPVEYIDDVPMVIEFKVEGKKEVMTIGPDYVECFDKRTHKPYILEYVAHCIR